MPNAPSSPTSPRSLRSRLPLSRRPRDLSRLILVGAVAAPLVIGASVASCTSATEAGPPSSCVGAAGIPCFDAAALPDGFVFSDATPFVLPDGTVADAGADVSQPVGDPDSGNGGDDSSSPEGDASDSSAPDASALLDASDASDAADAGPQPSIVANNLVDAPYYLAVGGGHAYWAGGSGSIYTAPTSGGTPTLVSSTGARCMTADANNLYWVSQIGDVYQVAHGSTAAIKLASSQYLPTVINTDGAYVYWNQTGSNAAFLRAPIGGGGDAGNVTPQTLLYPSGITFFGGKTYVAIENSGMGTSAATISVLPGDGGAPVTILGGLYAPQQLTNDGLRLYWTEDPGSTPDGIYSVQFDGGGVHQFTQNELHPQIISDGTWLYYTDTEYVLKTAADGTFGTTKLFTTSYPWQIAQDATYLYWADQVAKVIYRGVKY